MPTRQHQKRSGSSAQGGLLQRVVHAAASVVLVLPLPYYVALLVAGVIAKCWWGMYPAIDLELYVSSVFPGNPGLPAEAQYLMASLGGPALARLLGITTRTAFVWLHVAVLVVAVSVMGVLVYRRFGERAARLVALALALTQAPTLLLNWLGAYDAFTFLIVTVLALSSTWPLTLTFALALGLLHFEQGVFVVAALAAISPQRYLKRPAHAAALFGGLAAGKLLLSVYLRAIGVTAGRVEYLRLRGVLSTLQIPIDVIPVSLYALLGGAWVWVVIIGLRGAASSASIRRSLVVLALLVVPTLMTFDQTRVYALMSWPVILLMTLHFDHIAAKDDTRLLAGAGLLTFLVAPAVFVWEQVPRYPAAAAPWGLLGQAVIAAVGLLLVGWYVAHPVRD